MSLNQRGRRTTTKIITTAVIGIGITVSMTAKTMSQIRQRVVTDIFLSSRKIKTDLFCFPEHRAVTLKDRQRDREVKPRCKRIAGILSVVKPPIRLYV
jgi:hypothetical protein